MIYSRIKILDIGRMNYKLIKKEIIIDQSLNSEHNVVIETNATGL